MRFTILAAAAMLLAAPAFAQTSDSTATPAPKPKKEKKICHKAESNSYSRMTPSICRTQAEWDRDTSNGVKAGVSSMGGDNIPGR